MGGNVGVAMTELRVISQAWNEARDRAFARLREEADCVGAAAVVGVDVRSGTANWAEAGGYGAVEYIVNGTAVGREGHKHGRPPVLTELSVADYAKLLDAGVEPVGMVAWTSVFFVSWVYNLLMGSSFGGGAMQNFELDRRDPVLLHRQGAGDGQDRRAGAGAWRLRDRRRARATHDTQPDGRRRWP